MKLNQKTNKTSWIHIIFMMLAMSLAACDSGDDLTTDNKRIVEQTGPATGVLMDTTVSGVSYKTSSGKKGVTKDGGLYDFNHGDTVEFKLGKLTLGNVKAAVIVTPIELANGNVNKLQNLLILLQSLDSDSDLSNGISISSDTAAAVGSAIKLKSDPEKFIISEAFQAVLDIDDLSNAAVTADTARDHFLSQGTTMLGSHIWVRYDDTTANVIRVAADGSGEYLQGVATPDDSCDENRVCGGRTIIKAGMEYGKLDTSEFDTRGFKLIGIPTTDTNFKAGLSHPGPTRRIHTDGFELIVSDIVIVQREREQASLFGELFHVASPIVLSDDTEPVLTEVKEKRFSKMDNSPSGMVGAWVLDNESVQTKTLLFFPNNKFMLIDPTGETDLAEQSECGKPGIEFASYDYNSGMQTLTISSYLYDTNGCEGFSESSGQPNSFKMDADGNTAVLNKKGEKPITLYRVLS